MYIQRILRNAVLAELLLFLMVANCAPSRPREDVGQVPGDPASHLHHHHQPASASRSSSKKTPGAGSSVILSGHRRKYRLGTACSGMAVLFNNNENSTGDLLRFLPGGGVDARGKPSDPDTDVWLISEQSKLGGIVWIYSQSRKRFLCFNKKGKLVTKKNPSPNETLCQFSDTFVQDGGRHLISAYHSKNVPASHTLLDQLPIPVQTSTFHVTHRPSHKIDLDAWHVGFGRSGEPLKGSAWKTSKWKDCYSLVYHEEPARTATVHHAPLSENDMQQIFNQEWKLGSQKAPPPPPPQQQQAVPKGTSSKSNQLNNKPNKSSAKNKIHGRKATNSKHGVEKLEPTVAPLAAAKQSVHQGAKRSKATGAKHQKQTKARTTTQQHLLTTQASLPQSEERSDGIEQQRRANDVGFDVLLAQTEQLLAQAAALPATVAASLVPDDEPAVVEYSHRDPTAPPTHRSTFILLDSGGWQEVVLDEQPESHEPVRQEDDISA